jgi:hypothetical protein
MKEIQLTNSTQIAIVSKEDAERVSMHRWFIRKNGYIQSGAVLLH